MRELGGLPRLQDHHPPPTPLPDKEERDAYALPNSLASDNFIVRWGGDGSFVNADAEQVLEIFEYAWAVELDQMNQPAPDASDTYLFNVYISGTGDGAPDDYGAAGYFTVDRQGYPMIVLNRQVAEYRTYLETTVPHEFYHAVQSATGSYPYSGSSAWFYEAAASWIEVEVYPDNEGYASFLFGYALLPHLSVSFFDYPDTGALDEYHQYGAFIFLRYLAEYVGDWEIVRNAWVDPSSSDPMASLQTEVESLGYDWQGIFRDFALHNVTWDYEHGAIYQRNVDDYRRYFSNQDFEITDYVSSVGHDDWRSADPDLLPELHGYNVLAMESPPDGELRVAFAGEPESDGGRSATWVAGLVLQEGGDVQYVDLELVEGAGEVTLDTAAIDTVYLVVAPVEGTYRAGDGFDYTYWFEVPESEPDDEPPLVDGGEGGRACGCAAAAQSPGIALLSLGLGLLYLRRRHA